MQRESATRRNIANRQRPLNRQSMYEAAAIGYRPALGSRLQVYGAIREFQLGEIFLQHNRFFPLKPVAWKPLGWWWRSIAFNHCETPK